MNKRPPERMTRKGFIYVRLPFEDLGYLYLLADQCIQSGDVCIRGTRIPASTIWGIWNRGEYTIKQIRGFYEHNGKPYITERQIKACIEYVEGKPWADVESAYNQSLEPTPEQDVINESKDSG